MHILLVILTDIKLDLVQIRGAARLSIPRVRAHSASRVESQLEANPVEAFVTRSIAYTSEPVGAPPRTVRALTVGELSGVVIVQERPGIKQELICYDSF